MPIAQNSATMMPMPMPNPDAGFGWLAGQGRAQMSIWQQLSATGSPPEETPACEETGRKETREAADGSSGNAMCLERRREGGGPGGRSRRARPTVRFQAEREVGPSVGKTCLETRARRPESSRARVGGEIARAVAHELCAGALASSGSPRARSRSERPRRSPRDEIATDWNRIDETYQSFEEPFDGLVGQASGVRALRECEGHEGHEKDHGGSAHGYVRRDECASEARGGGVQM